MNIDARLIEEFRHLCKERHEIIKSSILDGQLDIRRYDYLAGQHHAYELLDELWREAGGRVRTAAMGDDDAG